MDYEGTTYEPVSVMWPNGDTFQVMMPQSEAAAVRSDGVIRFVLAREQSDGAATD